MTKAEGRILSAQIESLQETIAAIDCTGTLVFKTDYLENLYFELNSVCIKILKELEE